MNVLTVFAHPGSQSFCHAVLDRFDAGLRDAGHTNEVVDLYAIGFDPVLREHAYQAGLRDAMRLLMDEFTFKYPGIKQVEHVFFYAVHGADEVTRRDYLERAYTLGRQF